MAKQRMLQFVTVSREMPEKRAASVRALDFNEIYREFAAQKAAEQAGRCSQCGVPYCQTHCPLHNNIPDWLRMTAEGRLQEAYELAQATNTFPEICGRICPQDRLCEGNCVIEQAGHGTVTIGAIEKYITDTAWDMGWVKPVKPVQERAESVGIIGAGPGGLAAAEALRRAGIQVTVYDRYDRAGGLMTYGIPGFKLEKDVVMQRIAQLEQGGVQFVLNCNVGDDLAFDAIRGNDAVIIATGVYKSRDLGGPNANATGIVRAIDYLTAANRKSFGDDVPEFDSGELNAEGKRVVVIGGGDTAMDCVRTAIRQGAQSVKRGRQRRGGRRRFRLADRAARLHRRRGRRRRARPADAARRAGCHGTPVAGSDRRRRLCRARGSGDQGAWLRAGGSAEALGRRGAGGHPLGHREGRLPQPRDKPARCLRGGRHRARRLPCRLGDPRRARGRRQCADLPCRRASGGGGMRRGHPGNVCRIGVGRLSVWPRISVSTIRAPQ